MFALEGRPVENTDLLDWPEPRRTECRRIRERGDCSSCRGVFLDRGELDAALALVANADTTMISLIAAVIVEVPA